MGGGISVYLVALVKGAVKFVFMGFSRGKWMIFSQIVNKYICRAFHSTRERKKKWLGRLKKREGWVAEKEKMNEEEETPL